MAFNPREHANRNLSQLSMILVKVYMFQTDVIFLDSSIPFNKIPNQQLRVKLQYYRTQGNTNIDS